MRGKFGLLVSGIVIAIIATNFFFRSSNGKIDFTAFMLILAIFVMVMAVIHITGKAKNIRYGLSMKNESLKATCNAIHYSWLVSNGIVVGLLLFNIFLKKEFGLFGLTIEQIAGGVVLFSSVLFLWIIFLFLTDGEVHNENKNSGESSKV